MADDPIIRRLIDWAQTRADVRAAILTSTRTVPGFVPDPFSDYDIIYAVNDVRPYYEQRDWLGDFGPVLVVYRDPLQQQAGHDRFAYITQYAQDRLKIDFTIMHVGLLRHIAAQPDLPDDFDVGYRVLLDKDGLTAHLPPPTYTAYLTQLPTEAQYLEHIEVFFHEATYVAKSLWRDDLLPAKYSLDCMMKLKMLRQMLLWSLHVSQGTPVKPGAYGKGLKRQLAAEDWQALAATYTGADPDANWRALYATIALYGRLARAVGAHLAYIYPGAMEDAAIAYLRDVQALRR